MSKKFWVLLGAALLLGGAIAWVDTRPNWDDTGITAGMILLASGVLGAAMPSRAWVFALAVGLWIPMIGLARGHPPAFLAVLVAFAGAWVGALARRLLGATGGSK